MTTRFEVIYYQILFQDLKDKFKNEFCQKFILPRRKQSLWMKKAHVFSKFTAANYKSDSKCFSTWHYHGTQVFKERKVGRLVLIVKDHQLFTICAVDRRKKNIILMEKLSTMTYALTVTTPDLVFLRDASTQYKSEEKRKKTISVLCLLSVKSEITSHAWFETLWKSKKKADFLLSTFYWNAKYCFMCL